MQTSRRWPTPPSTTSRKWSARCRKRASRPADERTAAAIELAQRNNHVLTRIHHGNAPLSTIRDVLESEHDFWRWRVRVRVTQVHPPCAVHMCRPYCVQCDELLMYAPVRLVCDERAETEASHSAAGADDHANQLTAGGTTFTMPRVTGQKRTASAAALGDDMRDGNALAATQPPLPPCPRCGQVPTEWRYMAALTIRDDTDVLDVLLVDDDAVEFFEDVPAGDLRLNNCSRNVLEKKLAALLLPNQQVDMCVQSHKPDPAAFQGTFDDGIDASMLPAPPQRMYRVFDTFIQRGEDR